ncbi:MAG: DUF445 family protein [Carboxydocellales bacterium]
MLELAIIPLVGALIGWLTNVLAVKMLFRPYKPWVIPLIGYEIRGLIPKRHQELAILVGQVVEKELLSSEDIVAELKERVGKDDMVVSISDLIQKRVTAKIPSFLPVSVRTVVGELVRDMANKEIPAMMEQLLEQVSDTIREEVHLAKLVEERINNLDLHELERLVLSIAAKELKHIEYLGAVLGLLIGCLQLLLIKLPQWLG